MQKKINLSILISSALVFSTVSLASSNDIHISSYNDTVNSISKEKVVQLWNDNVFYANHSESKPEEHKFTVLAKNVNSVKIPHKSLVSIVTHNQTVTFFSEQPAFTFGFDYKHKGDSCTTYATYNPTTHTLTSKGRIHHGTIFSGKEIPGYMEEIVVYNL